MNTTSIFGGVSLAQRIEKVIPEAIDKLDLVLLHMGASYVTYYSNVIGHMITMYHNEKENKYRVYCDELSGGVQDEIPENLLNHFLITDILKQP